MKQKFEIGQKVVVKKNVDSMYACEWGIVKYFDGDDYYVAIWNGNEQMVFQENELKKG